ncbi:MAG: alpha-amylase family glycosyl hydrolase [Planctomycetota bacterium]
MGSVWYQVFPERFANGDTRNDPDEFGSTVLPWDASWYDTSGEEIEAAWNRRLSDPTVFRYQPSTSGGAFDGVVFQRRYGGDLQGVVEQLDHLRSLGVDGLYLCPVFASRSLHKYDARDHRHVDPGFGPYDPEGFLETFRAPGDPYDETTWSWTAADRFLIDVVIPEAKRRGMRVMLDGVWNHVGLDHWAFRDVVENGKRSRFAGWFDARFDDNGDLAGWSGWSRANGPLPEFLQVSGDINAGAKAHLFAVTRRWMDPNGDGDPSDGIDGWRLDVAAEIGRAFWVDWRKLVKSVNPDALIVAEIWHDADAWFDGTAFDSQMHYPFAFAATSWLGRTPGFGTRDFRTSLGAVNGRRPAVDLVQMTLLASHDTERLASMLSNPRDVGYDQGATRGDVWSGEYDPEPPKAALERSVLGAALQTVWEGAPMIYGGDEFGLPGADDPSNRAPIPWLSGGDVSVRDGYAGWFKLREHPVAGPVFRRGATRILEHPSRRVLAVSRRLDGVRVVAVLNSSDAPVRIGPLLTRFGLREWLAVLPQTGQLQARSAVAWVSER